MRILLSAAALVTAAACAGPMAQTSQGESYEQLLTRYPDLTAVEFQRLDDNNDGFVSAAETGSIQQNAMGGDNIVGDTDEVMVDDNM